MAVPSGGCRTCGRSRSRSRGRGLGLGRSCDDENDDDNDDAKVNPRRESVLAGETAGETPKDGRRKESVV